MSYSVPSPVNTSYAKPRKGRSDTVHDEIGALAEEPTFVDNAVHHVIYETIQNNSKTSQVSKPRQGDFQPTHQRKYRISEEESALRLAHATHEDNVFFNGEQLSTTSSRPMLLIDSIDHTLRLRTQSILTGSNGTRVQLNNMRGRTLNDISMGESTHVYAGQTVSVGLRSTDLVEKMFSKALHGLNSVGTRGISTLFVAQNFQSTALPAAVRFVARHDHYLMYYDRHGNFLYAPKIFNLRDRELGTQRGVAKTEVDPIIEVANRIVVKGKGIALNDSITVQVDDGEMQKRQGAIKQMTAKDPTATSESKARTSASQLLRLNKKAQGSLSSKAHSLSWDLEPADIVNFNNASIGDLKQAIVEATHTSTGESHFQLISYEAGLEGVINAMADGGEIDEEDDELDRGFQVQSINKSGVGNAEMKVRGLLTLRPVIDRLTRAKTTAGLNTYPNIHAGLLLAHRNTNAGPTRSALGFGYSPRINGTHAGSTITVTSTSGFADSGHLILDNKSFVSYSGKTATTFTGVTLISGATITSPIAEMRMLRPRAHEMRTTKGTTTRRKI